MKSKSPFDAVLPHLAELHRAADAGDLDAAWQLMLIAYWSCKTLDQAASSKPELFVNSLARQDRGNQDKQAMRLMIRAEWPSLLSWRSADNAARMRMAKSIGSASLPPGKIASAANDDGTEFFEHLVFVIEEARLEKRARLPDLSRATVKQWSKYAANRFASERGQTAPSHSSYRFARPAPIFRKACLRKIARKKAALHRLVKDSTIAEDTRAFVLKREIAELQESMKQANPSVTVAQLHEAFRAAFESRAKTHLGSRPKK